MQKTDSGKFPIKTLLVLVLSGVLAACGGDDNGSRLENINGEDVGGNDAGNGDDGGVDNDGNDDNDDTNSARLGRNTGTDFVAGEIEIGIPENSTLSAGGATTLSVTYVNDSGDLIAEPVTISFSSDCLSSGLAVLENTDEESESSVTTTTGRASVTYRANGCIGEDEIIATTQSDSASTPTARSSLFVDQDTLDQIQFTDATPNVIGIKGMGAESTTSEVRFRVVGENGSPLRGIDVDFALISPPAGATLASNRETSNSDGYVTARVRAGSGAGVVNVTATAEGSSTTSRELTITTTLPTQRHSSLALESPVLAAWKTDNVETSATFSLGDQNNNHIPEGTAVYFTASAGVIDGTCFTNEDSACSVTWRSRGDRPQGSGGVSINSEPPLVTCPGDVECRAGRVVVFATTEGNESFIDINTNGLFDPGTDLFATDTSGSCSASAPNAYIPPAPISEACDDLGPAYVDTNFDNLLSDDERVLDASERNGIYNGVLCRQEDHDSGACSRNSVTIRKSNTIVMASNQPYLPVPGLPGSVSIGLNETLKFDITIADENGNGMPPETSVEVSSDQIRNATASLNRDSVGGTSEPNSITLQIESSEEEAAGGQFEVVITSGSRTTYIPVEIN